MRRLVLVSLLGGLLLAVSGCGSQGGATGPTTATPATSPVTVGTSTTATSEADREVSCGTFVAPGETVRRTTWRVYARGVPCRVAYPVIVRFNRTGRPVPNWRCTGEDVLTRCQRGEASVRAAATE